MASPIARLYAEMDLKNGRFKRGADEVVRESGRMRKALGSVASTAAGFLAANVIQAGFNTIRNEIGRTIFAASDLNESISKTSNVFGKSANDILKWAKNSEMALGISEQAALDAASTFGGMGKQAGLAGKDLTKFSKDTVGAASDLGSFFNVDPTQVLEDIRSGLSGETEPLRKYNIFMNEAAVKTEALRLGLIKEGQELTEQQKILARHSLIMKGVGDAQGDFAETSGGLANGMRIATSFIQSFRVWLGQKTLPVVNRAVQAFNRFSAAIQDLTANGVSPLRAAFMAFRQVVTKGDNANGLSRFSEKVERLTNQLIALAPVIWKYAIRTFQTLLKIVGFLVKHLDTIAPIVAALVASFLLFQKVIKPIMAARQALIALRIAMLALNPWLLVLTAAVTLFALAYSKNWLGIRDITHKVIGFVVKQFQRFMAIVRGGKGLGKALEGLPKPLQKLGIAVRRVIVLFDDLLHGRWDELRRDWDRLGQTIGNLFKSIGLNRFGQEYKRFFSDIGDLITHVVDLVDDVIHGRWSEVWTDLGRIAVDLFHLFIGRFRLALALFRDLWDLIPWTDIGNKLLAGLVLAVQFMLDTGIPWLLTKGGELVTAIWDGMTGIWREHVRPWLHVRIEAIQNAIGDWYTAAYGWGSSLVNGIWDSATRLWENVRSWLSRTLSPDAIARAIGNWYGAALSWGASLINGLADGISSVWHRLTGWIDSILDQWNRIPAALRPGSPSKVMELYGESVPWGLAAGIEKMMPKLSTAVGRMNAAMGVSTAPVTPYLATRAITPAAGTAGWRDALTGGAAGPTYRIDHMEVYASDPEEFARKLNRQLRYRDAGMA
jgi:hypothetical protein